MKYLGQIGAHPQVEDLEQGDINGRSMFRCGKCATYTRDKHHFAGVACVTDCTNCNALRDSSERKPAVPLGGSVNTILHTCPQDGRRWWQSNDYYHMWQQVTDPDEWRALISGGYDRRDRVYIDDGW